MKLNQKALTITSALLLLLVFFTFATYLFILPKAIKTTAFQNFISSILNMNLIMNKPILKTSLNSTIGFSVDDLTLKKDNDTLIELDNFNIEFCLKNIFKKELKLNHFRADKIIVELDNLQKLAPKEKAKNQENIDFAFKFLNSNIDIKNFKTSYTLNKTKINLETNDFLLNDKAISINLKGTVAKNNKNYINILINSDKEIVFDKEQITIKDLDVSLNNSHLELNSLIDKTGIKLNAKSEKFMVADIFNIINSDLIIPNGEELLKPLVQPDGYLGFDINLKNEDILGSINLNNAKASLKDLSNLPLNISKGKININSQKIDFIDLIGYYGKNKNNTLKIYGDIKDYYKTFDSNLTIDTLITNEFFNDYLAKLINTNIYVSKPSGTRIIYKAKNNIMDITWLAKINKGVNFGVDEQKSALSDYDRAVKGDFRINGNNLDIKNINYYIAQDIKRGVKISPILVFDGNMDLDGKIHNAGIAFGREMPCEFLNIFARQQLFKKGTIKGEIKVAFKNDIPYLSSNMEINKTFVPSQRLFVKEASLKTNNGFIDVIANGKFKRASYDFKGKIKNELKPPFLIKNMVLDVDNIDIERLLANVNNQNQNVEKETEITSDEIQDDNYVFDTNLIRIKDSGFILQNGKYKELTFGNIKADIELDEKGLLKVQSNKFDIAQGISTLKVDCDLKDLKYYIRLGVKDVDSNLMAKVLLNLDKEITGLASGLIELNSDKSLKMNGTIKFLVNNGTIGKIGLVEYLLKIASVFRNPVVMVSPATIMDIISVPEGKFDKITGELKLKNNVVYKIDIKSYSKSLSALIKGRFDLNKHDASLRIYTRFSNDKKTMFGFLRKFSLNALANKVQMNTRNDANYYESELKDLPEIEVKNANSQVFLTQVEGDIEHFNFLSSLKKIK
ncbi:MAG: hypothetical protein IJW73_03085 [Candidatus Gastranaerophilales bacterium]|nr:hypothetical protein [Candidatus Gastranaerophilales bacterium]